VLQALLLKQPGSYMGDLLAQGLAAAGVSVTVVSSPYDLVVEAERAAGAFSHILVRVDYFGRDEFRLMPLVRREWPHTVVAAYHAPGFEQKGLLADLVGADCVLSTDADVSRFLETLGQPERAARPEEAKASPPSEASAGEAAAPPPKRPAEAPRPVAPAASPGDPAVLAASLQAALAHEMEDIDAGGPTARETRIPPAPPPAVARPPAAPAGNAPPSPVPRHQGPGESAEPVVELTEEELQMLLRPEDDE